MASQFVLILIAVVAGIAVTLQAQFMGVMDKQIGTLESVFITYGSGGLVIGLTMLILKGGSLASVHKVPIYVLSAGLLGLLIVAAIGYCTPRLGLVGGISIIVAAQFVAAAVLDHFGFPFSEIRPLTLNKVTGMAIVCLGVWLIIK